jgi:hypothetical protein
MHVFLHQTYFSCKHTAILIITEGQFQVFQRFSSSKLVLKTVESCFVALNYYGNGSTKRPFKIRLYTCTVILVQPLLTFHTHTHTCAYIHTHTYTCIHTHTYTCIHTYTHTHAYLPVLHVYSVKPHMRTEQTMQIFRKLTYVHTCRRKQKQKLTWSIHTTPHTYTHTYTHTQAETIAKINMVGSYDAAIKKMESDGIPRSSLPDFMGGGSKGIKTVDYVAQLIQVCVYVCVYGAVFVLRQQGN